MIVGVFDIIKLYLINLVNLVLEVGITCKHFILWPQQREEHSLGFNALYNRLMYL